MHQTEKIIDKHVFMRKPNLQRKARRRARIADIAAKAEVGTATVDRVLNKRGGVSERTKQKVREAMAALEGQRGFISEYERKFMNPISLFTVSMLRPLRSGAS